MLQMLSSILVIFLLMRFYFTSHQEGQSLEAMVLMILATCWLATRQKVMIKS
jgi:hypothetical protein